MKIKPTSKYYRGLFEPEGTTLNSFDIVYGCCDRFDEEFAKSHLIFMLNKNQTIDFGSPHEYIQNGVKFCPFCGEKITVET